MGMTQIKNTMAELKFHGMLQNLERTLQDATSESWGYTEFIDSLLQAESDSRKQKKIEAKIKFSKLKTKPAFEDFDFTAKRTISKNQVKELYNLKWISQGRPILLIGQTGVGKTFISQALGMHACRHNYSVLFMTVTTLIENLSIARASGSYLKFKDKIIKPDVFILDDFGLRKLSSTESQDLCEILEERSMNKSTIITTQLPVDHWSEVIPDPVIADAIIDRLIHSAISLTIEGDSYRKIKAKKLKTEK